MVPLSCIRATFAFDLRDPPFGEVVPIIERCSKGGGGAAAGGRQTK